MFVHSSEKLGLKRKRSDAFNAININMIWSKMQTSSYKALSNVSVGFRDVFNNVQWLPR